MIALASIGSAVWGFIKRLPDWVMWLAAGLLLLKFVDMRAEGRGRKDEKQKAEIKTIETVNEIQRESVNDADKAIEARDTAVRVSDPASVPDQVAGRIFRD